MRSSAGLPAAAGLAVLTACLSCGVRTVRPWVYRMSDSTLVSSHAYGISETDDGGCVFAGRVIREGDGETDLLAVRLDSRGRERWRRVFGRPGFLEEGYDAVALPDGRIALVGVRADGSGLAWDDSWVLMLDGGGDVIWERTYPLPGYDLAVCVEPRAGGGLLVGGETDAAEAGRSNDIRVIALDGDGEMLWETFLASGEWDDPGALLPTADGGCLLLATSGPMDQPGSDMWLVRLDGEGGILSEERFDSGRPDEGNAICSDGEGGFFLAGTSGIIQADDLDIRIRRMDADGSEIWSRSWGGNRDDAVASAVAAPDGGLAIAGRIAGAPGALLFDASGSIVWRTRLGMDSASGICVPSGGGFAVAGTLDGCAAVILLDGDGKPAEGYEQAME